MSRRLRVEEEQRAQTTKDEFEDEDKLKTRRERIYAPILWRRLEIGFLIKDLKEIYFEETLELLKEHYIPNEVLSRNTEMMDDEPSVENFLDKCLYYLKETSSLAAFHEIIHEAPSDPELPTPPPSYELAGVLIMRPINKVDYGRVFSRLFMNDGDSQKKCTAIRTSLYRKVDLYETMDCDSVMRLYYVCIKPQFRNLRIGLKLLYSALDAARLCNIKVMMGIFSDYSMQKLAKKIGMETVHEISYTEWRDKNGEMIFDDPGACNYTCSLMAGYVPAESIPEPDPPVIEPEEPVKVPKVTRRDKQEAVEKRKRKAEAKLQRA